MPAEMNKEGICIKPNNRLSETNKAFMAINYPFFNPNPNNASPKSPTLPLQKFKDALDIAGVAGDMLKDMLKFFAKGNWEEI